MIDLAEIVEKIQKRLKEMDTTAAVVSAQATDSKDTIRNWERAVEADRQKGTNKASATTIKLNQIERALGIELARNAVDPNDQEAQFRSALRAYGVKETFLEHAIIAISGFRVPTEGQPQPDRSHDQSEPASRPHGSKPSQRRPLPSDA